MKRLLSVLLVAMLIVTSLATVTFAAGSATVSASSATACAGDTVTVSFTLSGSEFASYGMQISADSVLTLTDIRQGAASNGSFVGNPSNGVVGFGGTYNCAPGQIFTATFKVSDSAKPGKYPVTVVMDFVSDEKQNDLAVSVVTGYVTVECSGHKWSEWKTVSEPSCVTEGKAERTCSVCGEVESKTLPTVDHKWGSWNTVQKPTCTVAGKAERTCSVCGEVESKVLPTVDHKWGSWNTVQKPTCTEDGKEERTCSVCGEVESKVLPAVGHTWGEWKTVQIPLCEIPGKAERTCSVCGEVESKVLAALVHGVSTDWNYDDNDHWHVCDNGCGVTFDSEPHDFEWVITKNPTSTKPGLKHEECSVCGYKRADVEIPADPSLDDVPGTGDITPVVILIGVAILGILLLAAYVLKCLFARHQF